MPQNWDLDAFIQGLRLLGSGGGGDPQIMGVATRPLLEARPVEWVGLDDLPVDGWVAPVGYLGATAALREKLPAGQEFVAAVSALARWSGVEPVAVMAVEMAGVNGIAALETAQRLSLPLLDADFTGRAFPRLDQLSVCIEGRLPTPCVVTEPGGATVLLDGTRSTLTEDLLRSVIARVGGWAALAFAFQPVKNLADVSILGTAQRALDLGRALALQTPLADISDATVLAEGRITFIETSPRTGGGPADVTIIDAATGAIIRLEAVHEFVRASRDGLTVCAAPDIISLVAPADRQVVGIDDLRVGRHVAVLALAAPPWWRERPERAQWVGPETFGLQTEDFT